jgi:hypothetical protein
MSDPRITKLGCFAAIALALMAGAVILRWSCTVCVPANMVGVRTLLTSTGVENRDYGPGFVLCIPGFHKVRLWDPTWSNSYQTLQVRGSDQYTTTVDISVLYRIKKGFAHEAAQHFQDYNHIEQSAKSALSKFANEILAQMSTEDFYNSKIRTQKAEETRLAMEKQLEPFGLEVKKVLLRNIVYDPKFEAQLLQKQLAGQRKSLEIALSQKATAETETSLISRRAESEVKRIDESKQQEIENLKAETDRKIAQMIQDAKMESATLVAKSESSKRQKLAQADLVKANAAAKGTELMSKVYSQSGAQYYFARKALEGMKLGDIELNSNTFNPIDIERLLKAVGLDNPSLKVEPVPVPATPVTPANGH